MTGTLKKMLTITLSTMVLQCYNSSYNPEYTNLKDNNKYENNYIN